MWPLVSVLSHGSPDQSPHHLARSLRDAQLNTPCDVHPPKERTHEHCVREICASDAQDASTSRFGLAIDTGSQEKPLIVQILAHTPIWVYALFFVLLAFGLIQTRTRTVRKMPALLLPAGMTALSLFGSPYRPRS